jgi:integrase
MGELTRGKSKSIAISESAKKYIQKSKADSTLRVYQIAVQGFVNFADSYGEFEEAHWIKGKLIESYSPQAIVEYLAFLADKGKKVNTIQTYLAGIAWMHLTAGYADPTSYEIVKATMKGIRRVLLIAPDKKDPIDLDDLHKMINVMSSNTKGTRDRAILLVGLLGAFRRSELVGIDVEHMRFGKRTRILLPRSKTDQEGKGKYKFFPLYPGHPLDPTAALKKWLTISGIESGPVFRWVDRHGNIKPRRLTAQSIALIVKEVAEKVGLNPKFISAHSLRSGFVTECKSRDAADSDVMAQTGHEAVKSLREYDHALGDAASRAVDKLMKESK